MKRIGIGFILGLTVLAMSGCVDRKAQAQGKETQKVVTDPSTLVVSTPAKIEDVPNLLSLTGAIASGEDSTIGAKNPGRLVAVYVKDGDQVSAGQVIATIESSDAMSRVAQARANVDSARAQLQQVTLEAQTTPTKTAAAVRASEARVAQAQKQLQKLLNGSRSQERKQAELNVARTKSDLDTAEKNLKRTRALVKEGALAEQDLEAAQNRYEAAMVAYRTALESQSLTDNSARPEDIAAARDNVAQAQEQLKIDRATKSQDPAAKDRVLAARAALQSAQEGLRQAETYLSDLTIRSSFTGRISGKPTQVGTFVGPGGPVARVIGGAGIYFEAEVTESDFTKLRLGLPVKVSLDALPGLALTGTVVGLNPLASTTGRLFSVRIGLHEKLPAISPGMFARGEVQLSLEKGQVTVPIEALLRDGENVHLFVAEGNKAKRVEIKVVSQTKTRAAVTGLSSGQLVIIQGQSALADGSLIKEDAGIRGKAGN